MTSTIGHRIGDGLITSSRFRAVMMRLFSIRGGRAIAHVVRSRLYRPRTVVIDDFDGDLEFECHLDEHMGSQIFWRGSYSASQLTVLDQLLHRDDLTFVDIGANQGEFSLFAAKRLRHGQVVAFEPDPELSERLRRNLGRNGFDSVTVRQHALWHEDATLELHRPAGQWDDGSTNEGLGSLYASPGTTVVDVVDCRRLDDVVEELDLARVDVIKIDVEGAEVNVLRGAQRTLSTHSPILLVEADRVRSDATEHDVESLLDILAQSYDMEIIDSSGQTRPLDVTQMSAHENVVCIPRRAASAAA